MILISHRGNINGKNPEMENSPDYIFEAIDKGYDVEIDVWMIDGNIYLGHDNPEYKVSDFEFNDKMWIHCKNLQALYLLRRDFNCFFHTDEDFVLTSKNHIWTYPGKELTRHSICVLPETVNYSKYELTKCVGICSDFIEKYKLE